MAEPRCGSSVEMHFEIEYRLNKNNLGRLDWAALGGCLVDEVSLAPRTIFCSLLVFAPWEMKWLG